jgi:hypothetical protein
VRELGVATAVLGVLALVVFGTYVRDGGFLMDDWINAAIAQFGGSPLDTIDQYRNPAYPSANHVGLPVAFALQFGVLGDRYGAHLAFLLLTSVLVVVVFYALLRDLKVPALHAGAMAALVLVWPFADSTRFWPTLAFNNVAVALWFGGILAALHGLRHERPRWHVLALALYAISILLYELTAAGVALSAALYLFVAPPRKVLPRWIADLLVTAASLVAFLELTPRRPSRGLDYMVEHLGDLLDQLPDLLAGVLWPFGGLPGGVAVAILIGVAALGVARGETRGLLMLGVGLFVPAEEYYLPLYPNQGNRVNIVAAFAFVVLLYGAALILAAEHRAVALAAIIAAAVIGVGYVIETRKDADDWSHAFALEQRTLSRLKQTVPKPPPNVTVYVYGQAGRVAEGIPVFDWRFDLTGAAKLMWDDPSINAYPILDGTDIVCDVDRLFPLGNGLDTAHGTAYETAIFADVRSGRYVGIDSPEECDRERQRFTPAPLLVPRR